MLEEGKFDSTLKSALDRLQVPYDASSWNKLEQRLTQSASEEMKEPVLDQHFRKVLQGLEAPYNSAHWDMMADRIVRENRIRRRIWITKFAEAAVFLLLVANLDGLLGGLHDASNDHLASTSSSTPVAEAGFAAGSTNGEFATRSNNHGGGSQDHSGFWAAHGSAATAIVLSSIEPATSASLDGQTSGSDILYSNGLSSANATALVLNTDAAAISVLDPLPLLQQNSPISETFAYAGLPNRVHQKVAKQRNFYAMVFLGGNQNQIHQGNDLRKVNGGEAGIMAGYRKGKWGVESGLAYSKKVFQPKRKIEINTGSVTNGYYGTYVDKVEADVVSVPVHVTRRIGQYGRVTLQAVAGSTANFAVQKAFKNKTIYFPGLSPNQDPNAPNFPQTQNAGNGVFEHGTVAENFYASVDAGIRVEKPVGKSFTVFLEPMVQMSLTKKGIGPDPSKINTFSVRAGVIASL